MNEMPSENDNTRPETSPSARPSQPDHEATEETRQFDQTRPAVDVSSSDTPPPHTRGQKTRQRQQRPPASGRRRRASQQRASAAPPASPIQKPPGRPVQQRSQTRPQRDRVPPSQSGLYFPWWSLVIMVVTVGVVAFGLLFAFTELSEPATPGDQVPRIQVITAQPTLSQDFGVSDGQAAAPADGAWPTAIPRAQPSATVALPTPVPTQTLPPGDFSIGASVQVVGVEQAGLNIRSAPGLDGAVVLRAEEGSIFAIVGGPQDADGYKWWKLEDPDNPGRVGWAARNFLMIASQ